MEGWGQNLVSASPRRRYEVSLHLTAPDYDGGDPVAQSSEEGLGFRAVTSFCLRLTVYCEGQADLVSIFP